MPMKLVKCKFFPPKGYAAITLMWWIIVRDGARVTPRLVNHEFIHHYQQKEISTTRII